MSTRTYLRRLLIGLGLSTGLVVISPLLVFGSIYLACGSSGGGGGCAAIGMLIILAVILPGLLGVLSFLAWVAHLRIRSLQLPVILSFLCFLLLCGVLRSAFSLFAIATDGYADPIDVAPPLLSIFILITLYFVPEPSSRGGVRVPLQIAFLVSAGFLISRLSDSVFYPFRVLTSGDHISSAMHHLSAVGPLVLIPNWVAVLMFILITCVISIAWIKKSKYLAKYRKVERN